MYPAAMPIPFAITRPEPFAATSMNGITRV